MINKIPKYLNLSAALFILLSCSAYNAEDQDFKKVINERFSEPEEIVLKEIYRSVEKVKHPYNITFGSDGTVYFLGYRSDHIHVFDQNTLSFKDIKVSPEGGIISSLSTSGNDLIISCAESRSVFIQTGPDEFEKIELENGLPENIIELPGGYYFGSFRASTAGRDETYFAFDLKMTDRSFNTERLLSSYFDSFLSGNTDPETTVFPFVRNSITNTLFVAISSDKYYKILAYNDNLKAKYMIANELETVSFTKDETERLNKMSELFRMPPFRKKQKDIIEDMHIDMHGRLWVRRASDADIYGTDSTLIDIFGTDGRYIKTVIINGISRIERIGLNGNRLFVANPFGSSIRIYEFDYKILFGDGK